MISALSTCMPELQSECQTLNRDRTRPRPGHVDAVETSEYKSVVLFTGFSLCLIVVAVFSFVEVACAQTCLMMDTFWRAAQTRRNEKTKALHLFSCCLSPCFIFSLSSTSSSIFTPLWPLWPSTPPLSPSLWIPLLLSISLSCTPHPLPNYVSLHPSHLSILPCLHLSQYFDEEQDDHEYPYYYEETTGVPSSSAPPPPRPGAPNPQVKREQEREGNTSWVCGGDEEWERKGITATAEAWFIISE